MLMLQGYGLVNGRCEYYNTLLALHNGAPSACNLNRIHSVRWLPLRARLLSHPMLASAISSAVYGIHLGRARSAADAPPEPGSFITAHVADDVVRDCHERASPLDRRLATVAVFGRQAQLTCRRVGVTGLSEAVLQAISGQRWEYG